MATIETVLQQTNLIPPLVKDYLAGNLDASITGIESYTLDGIAEKASTRNLGSEQRADLVAHLRKQYQQAGVNLSEGDEVLKNIQLLEQQDTYTVVTGHQLALFGGPMFMTWKILTAVKLARAASEKLGKPVVPVLWLASEDHDFEEISATYLFGKRINWEKESHSKPVGRLDMEGMSHVLDHLLEIAGQSAHAGVWAEALRSAYLEGNLSQATIKFYHQLYASFGLVILDPDAIVFKKAFKPYIREDIVNGMPFQWQQPSDAHLGRQYKLQINARECNHFYLHPEFGRQLLKKSGEAYEVGQTGQKFSKAEIETFIEDSPERFSPNVNLRPVFQEVILPNLAYVGGPAEVAYWLQLKPIFDGFKVQFPMVVLRNMAVLPGGGFASKLDKSGLSHKEIIQEEVAVKERVTAIELASNPEDEFEKILNQMQDLVEHIRAISPGLGKDFLAEKLKVRDFFKSKTGEVKRAKEELVSVQITRALKLRSKVFPDGVFQERIETLMQAELFAGRPLLTELEAVMDPLPLHLKWIIADPIRS